MRIVAVLCALDSLDAVAADPVALFSPQGTVKNDPPGHGALRRADGRARRSTPADPFDIDCAGAGTRSLGRRTQLGLRLRRRSAGRHSLHVQAAQRPARPRRRAACTSTREFRFDTGGPAIRASLPRHGAPIDADQIIHARARRAGDTGIDRTRGLLHHRRSRRTRAGARAGRRRTRRDPRAAPRTRLQLLPDPVERRRAVDCTRARSRARSTPKHNWRSVACKRALPPDTKMQLVWGAGIEAPSGIATTTRSEAGVPGAAGVHRARAMRARQRARRLYSAAADSVAVQCAGTGCVGQRDAHRRR